MSTMSDPVPHGAGLSLRARTDDVLSRVKNLTHALDQIEAALGLVGLKAVHKDVPEAGQPPIGEVLVDACELLAAVDGRLTAIVEHLG